MAFMKLVLALMFCVIACASGQAIVDNLYPKVVLLKAVNLDGGPVANSWPGASLLATAH